MAKTHKAYTSKQNFGENIAIYNFFFNFLFNIYCITYSWDGFPENVDTEFLEQSLIEHGTCVAWDDPILGEVALPASPAGSLRYNGKPKKWRAFGMNGFSQMVNNKDCCYIYNVTNGLSDLPVISYFAGKLANIDVSEDVNLRLQRYPGFIRCTENQKLTLINIMEQFMGGSYLIFGDKELDLVQNLEHIDLKVPYIADKLNFAKRDVFMEALNYIGIQYSSSNKRERLASTEIDSNIGLTEAARIAHLAPRKRAAERMNKKFGWNVSVDINTDIVNMLKIADINPNAQDNMKTLYGSSSGERQAVTNG